MEILDSRGNPTLRVYCELYDGTSAAAEVPSGASTGKYEALELRDKDPKRYGGKGVLEAAANVNEEIRNLLAGKEFEQNALDRALNELDGTKNKSRLGANALLGVSLSFARASALAAGTELFRYIGKLYGNDRFSLPTPMLNVINGGKHADSGLDIQEFMLVPENFSSVREKIRAGEETIKILKGFLEQSGYAVSLGDEGGFAPKLPGNEEAIDLLEKSIAESGYKEKIKISLDAAASTFYKDGKYRLKISGRETETDSAGLISWYEKLCGEHPLLSIEDGMDEDDWDGFAEMTRRLGSRIKVVGDDLTVTNPSRIMEAEKKETINAVIIKPNQIGTLSEALEAVRTAKDAGWTVIVSHRSGDTPDSFIADLAVGVSAEYLKSGSLARAERVAKYNRLLEIEDLLSSGGKSDENTAS